MPRGAEDCPRPPRRSRRAPVRPRAGESEAPAVGQPPGESSPFATVVTSNRSCRIRGSPFSTAVASTAYGRRREKLARRCTTMAMRRSFAAQNTVRRRSTCAGLSSCTSELARCSLIPWRRPGLPTHRASSSRAYSLSGLKLRGAAGTVLKPASRRADCAASTVISVTMTRDRG